MRIRYILNGDEKFFESAKSHIVVGRRDLEHGIEVDLDLTPDLKASRSHAQIGLENGKFWIEDPKSTRGTKVDGEEIKGRGKITLTEKSGIQIGDTTLFIDRPTPIENLTISPIVQADEPAALCTLNPAGIAELGSAAATNGDGEAFKAPVAATLSQQRLLHDLLFQMGVDAPLDKLLQFAIERLVAAVGAAQRGALLLRDASSGELLLKAQCPDCELTPSTSLAEHAIACGGGFIWKRSAHDEVSVPELASGIYAPLTWRGETFGVVCVDNSSGPREFSNEDLELVVAAAQHLALVIANYQMRNDLRSNATLVERLLTNFSPAIRKKLVEKARHGRLRLGGEKSEVTILSSDIRGFTKLTSAMDAADIVDLLNAYFSALVSAVFKHDGTIDKFVGDAILAVFGSPEPDPKQHLNAINAAMAMQDAIDQLNAARRANNQTTCEMGIGVHSGEVLHGFIGSDERMEFTVIGDAVNRASRYCDGAAAGQVVISPDVFQRVFKHVNAKQMKIKTKHEGDLPAYLVEGLKVIGISTLLPVAQSAKLLAEAASGKAALLPSRSLTE